MFDSRAVVMQSVPFFLRGAFKGARQSVSSNHLQRVRTAFRVEHHEGVEAFHVAVQTSKRWEMKSVSDCFKKTDGSNGWLSAGRQSAKSISLPSDADAGKGRTMEFRRPWTGHTFGAFGRVVCNTSSPRRRQRCAGNDGHIKITDKPGSSACGQTCTEPRDLAIGTNGGSSIGW